MPKLNNGAEKRLAEVLRPTRSPPYLLLAPQKSSTWIPSWRATSRILAHAEKEAAPDHFHLGRQRAGV